MGGKRKGALQGICCNMPILYDGLQQRETPKLAQNLLVGSQHKAVPYRHDSIGSTSIREEPA